MARVPGFAPKPEGEAVTRHRPTVAGVEVPNVPYMGKKPALPRGYPKETVRWWKVVSRMPHCAIWTDDDWQFAIETAEIHARFIAGRSGADAELRRRGDAMGMTWVARRNLRIQYVNVAETPEAVVDGEALDFEAERSRRLMEA